MSQDMSDKIMLMHALEYANQAYAGIFRRRSPLPYIYHPMAVAKRIWGWGIRDVKHQIVALLHDVVEDTDITAEQLSQHFDKSVVDAVVELSCIYPDGISRKDSEALKEQYMRDFENRSLLSLVVKISDRLENIYDFHNENNNNVLQYAVKGMVLYEILNKRPLELEAAYGRESLVRIIDDFDQLLDMLHCEYEFNFGYPIDCSVGEW